MATIFGTSGKIDNCLLREKTNINDVKANAFTKIIFEIVEFGYISASDEYGVKETKRVDTIIFEGSIVECQAYLQLRSEGYLRKADSR
jgi:hypothetical protein